ncbi:unnamed protein product [Pleuronectes platessa]|uniref:Uncharacterized protein n=1 Tax=Pleuronectes platessa TaxID=8262 RepID=A0A9N7TJ96_PLEPL|nr:unnamed protein product [Pleuronectes platessa]
MTCNVPEITQAGRTPSPLDWENRPVTASQGQRLGGGDTLQTLSLTSDASVGELPVHAAKRAGVTASISSAKPDTLTLKRPDDRPQTFWNPQRVLHFPAII